MVEVLKEVLYRAYCYRYLARQSVESVPEWLVIAHFGWRIDYVNGS